MRTVAMISVGVFLAACSVKEPVSRDLTMNLPDTYSMIAPISRPKTEDLEWWRNFNDPVLTKLVTHGMSGNLDLAQARERLREAEANARRAQGGIVTGDGDLDVNRRRNGSDSKDIRLSAELNLAGRDLRRAEAALSRLEAERWSEDESRRVVATEITVTYLNLRFQQQLLKSRTSDLASRRQIAEYVQLQVNEGAATRLDQLRTRSLEAETRIEIPQIESEIVRQRNRLSTLLGIPVGALSIDLRYPGRQPLPRRLGKSGVPADLLRARPDIQRAERLYAAAISDVDAARAARYPSLKLSGLLSAPLGAGASTTGLLAGLVLPVFNQPALAADVDGAEARVNQAYLQWRVAVLQAVEQVETAQSELRGAIKARAAAQEVVAMNQEALELSRILLSSSSGITALDVVDRERTLSASQVALARSTRDVSTSYADLRSALGQGHGMSAKPARIAETPDGAAKPGNG